MDSWFSLLINNMLHYSCGVILYNLNTVSVHAFVGHAEALPEEWFAN